MIGFIQAQLSTGVEIVEKSVTYSTGGDSLVTGVTINSYAVDLRKDMTVREDPLSYGVMYDSRPVGITYKMPTKLSFQWIVIETLTESDSVVLTKGIQFSDDSTTWTTSVVLDTLVSLIADTNATVSDYWLMETFPHLRYFRINSVYAAEAGDTVSVTDKAKLTY